jgi:PAS domain S-box-containing protein
MTGVIRADACERRFRDRGAAATLFRCNPVGGPSASRSTFYAAGVQEGSSAPLVDYWHALVGRDQNPSLLIDSDGRLVAVSPKLAAALGYTVEEMVGGPALELVHPDDRERTREDWAERRTQGSDSLGFHSRWRRKAGNERWLSWYAMGDADTGHVYAVAKDITERKRQDLLFRETESVAHIGGWELDLVTQELYWTEETYRLHDTTPEEHTPRVESGIQFYTEESRGPITAALERLIADGTPFDLRLELITARGRRIACRAKGKPVLENGRPVRVYGVFQDITEEAKVELALRESEELLRSVLRDMRAGLVAQLPDGSIFFTNQAALDILGLTDDQIRGRTSTDPRWYSIHEDGSPFPGQDHPAMVSLRTGESLSEVIMGVYRPRTDERAWILIDSVVHRNDRGEIGWVLTTFVDITERKRAEDAKRESDAMLRAVYLNAGLGVLLRDAQTEKVECNPTFERMVGRTSAELGASTMSELVHPEDVEASAQAHADLLAGRVDSYALDRRFVRADGGIRWGHETVSLVRGPDDAPRYVVEMVLDITDRKQMETQLILADRLASLGTMAAGVGHEINNPLTWIVGNITLALDLMQDLGPSGEVGPLGEIRDALEEASSGASRVSTIVRDLRLFSRVDDTPGATADPNQVVQSTSRMLRNELKHRTELQLDLEPVPKVIGDAPRIGQILTNLLVNALHALPDRSLRQNLIRVSTRLEDGHVILAVSDNGVGIPPALQLRVFDPFFTTKEVGSGTGLGLSICHSLVNRLGGRIELESEVGRGTVFRVFLRPASADDKPLPLEGGADESSRRKRILCIDDEPSVGRLIARFLQKAHDVVVETDSEQAIERLQNGERYDAIICDIMMPIMSGIEFFDRLKGLDPALAERCGFITGGVFTERARSFADALPPTHLVRKPFQPKAIKALVDCLTAA